MTNRFLAGTLLCALLGFAPAAYAGGATHTYSNADFKGTDIEKFSGFVGGATPFTAADALPQTGTGFVTADGNGNFTAALIFNIGGNTCAGTVSGTYQVFSTGVGTSTGTFTPQSVPPGVPSSNYACPTQMTGAQDEAFAIVSRDLVNVISIDGDSVASGTAERQGNHHD